MWLEDQKVRSIYRRSAASSLKMKTVICTLWALALVCVVTEARPSASVSETRLDGSRAQNPLESSEPFWIFHTPTRPVMYLPGYNSVLVPANSDQIPTFVNPPYSPLIQPPRRRRPLLTILKLLQGGRIGVSANGELVEVLAQPMEVPRDDAKDQSDVTQRTEDVDERVEIEPKLIGQDFSNHGRQFQLNRKYKTPLDCSSRTSGSDDSVGFSYMYRYSSPKSQSANANDDVEVSVQMGNNKAYPHGVNRDAFEGVKDDTALKLVDPFVLTKSIKPVPSQGVQNKEPKGGSNNKKTENVKENATLVVGDVSSGKPTRLILKPSAKAVAGIKGVAIAAPVARAVIRRGQKVTVEFDPDAVAIAGPGGRAHAHPQFSIDYIDDESDLTGSERQGHQ